MEGIQELQEQVRLLTSATPHLPKPPLPAPPPLPASPPQQDILPLHLKALMQNAVSSTEILAIELLADFKRDGALVRCSTCHKTGDGNGIRCPSDEECLDSDRPRRKLSRAFLNFKRSVCRHVRTPEHVKLVEERATQEKKSKEAATRNQQAGLCWVDGVRVCEVQGLLQLNREQDCGLFTAARHVLGGGEPLEGFPSCLRPDNGWSSPEGVL